MIPIDYSLIGRYLLAKENNVFIHFSRALSGENKPIPIFTIIRHIDIRLSILELEV